MATNVNIFDAAHTTLLSNNNGSLNVNETNPTLAQDASLTLLSNQLPTKHTQPFWNNAVIVNPNYTSAIVGNAQVNGVNQTSLYVYGTTATLVTITLQMMVPNSNPVQFFDTQYTATANGNFGYSLTAAFYGLRLRVSGPTTISAYAVYC